MYFWKSLFHLLAYLLSGTDKLYWSCHFPGWTSPFSHLLIGQVLQLRLVWPSTGLPPVGRSLSIPEGPKTEQSIQMGSQESWTERDSPSFNILAFSPWLLSWGFVGHFQSWSTSLAYNQLVSARAHRSFPVEMPLIRPQPVSLLPAQGQSLISVIVAFHETFLPISLLWLGCSGKQLLFPAYWLTLPKYYHLQNWWKYPPLAPPDHWQSS